MASRAKRNIVFSCQAHVVFCPKYRRHVLVNGIEWRLQQISAEVAEETDSIWLETEVMPDHVHVLIAVNPQFGIHRMVKAIRRILKRLSGQEETFPGGGEPCHQQTYRRRCA
jgi:putative transposase